MNRKIIVGITQGDSNGIGYEVIIKALSDSRILDSFTPVIYGSSKLFGLNKKLIHNIDPQMDTHVITSASEARPKKINIINCIEEESNSIPGQSTPDSAKAAIMALEKAVEDIKQNYIDVIVTAPINKKAMNAEGFNYPGHTEYLEKEFNAKDIAMIMVSNDLKIGIVTGHIPLKEVSSQISQEKILEKLRVMRNSLKQDFCIEEPKIAVLGLNPHCGDGGLLGSEEKDIILPAIKEANKEGILAFGPYSPDGHFSLDNYRKFDATLAMYHDQGLSPFKALAFETGVNFTAGLPIVRTSPDHGTAFEMAGKDNADPLSMRSAIYLAIDIFHNRENYQRLLKNKMEEKKLDSNERPQRGYKNQIA